MCGGEAVSTNERLFYNKTRKGELLMDSYYSDLATSRLNKAALEISGAIEYAKDAKAPEWLIKSLYKTMSALHNRVREIHAMRKSKK